MPAIVRSVGDERDALVAFLEHERHVVVVAAYGLTDDQAWLTPTASDMSIGFLLEHLTSTERTWASMLVGSERAPDPAPVTAIVDLVAAYEVACAATGAALAMIDDLDRPVRMPEGTRWAPPGTEWNARWVLLHLVHETARHAGHADIIREALDGATCWTLMARAEGWPGHDGS